MAKSPHFLAVILVPLFLAACSGMQLGKAEKVQPQGTLYQVSLYNGYIKQARHEFAEADYIDSDRFADRAILAGAGNNVEPEGLNARDIPSSARADLRDARSRLTALKGQGAINYLPALMARIQVAFDCWMQEQEENFQPADIAACRGEFFGALTSAEEFMDRKRRPVAEAAKVAKAAKAAPAAAKVPAPAAAPVPPAVKPAVHTVYFETNSDRLTQANAAVVRKAANQAKARRATKILVGGHTDRAGDIRSNAKLSERRAAAVVRALVSHGILASSVSAESFGEAQPANPTQDGVASVFNRRVVISF
jgi:outer membrane protein OmpA-like peptidoglycan-associated protein